MSQSEYGLCAVDVRGGREEGQTGAATRIIA